MPHAPEAGAWKPVSACTCQPRRRSRGSSHSGPAGLAQGNAWPCQTGSRRRSGVEQSTASLAPGAARRVRSASKPAKEGRWASATRAAAQPAGGVSQAVRLPQTHPAAACTKAATGKPGVESSTSAPGQRLSSSTAKKGLLHAASSGSAPFKSSCKAASSERPYSSSRRERYAEATPALVSPVKGFSFQDRAAARREAGKAAGGRCLGQTQAAGSPTPG